MSGPRVFVSYSHDSEAHRERVRSLADRLRHDGIDVCLDRYEQAPVEGWRRWMERQVDEADHVLLVCTETYARRLRGDEAPGRGLGSQWEGVLLSQELYEAGVKTERLLPVILEASDAAHVPRVLRDFTHYLASDDAGYDQLYRRLTKQPEYVAPPIGEVRSRPARPSAWSGAQAGDQVRVAVDRLPPGGRHFVAREAELRRLDDAWGDERVNAISIVAMGGVGKSALVDRWLTVIQGDDWRGARRVYGWSFYSQGTKERLTAADQFIDEALRWFGDEDRKKRSARDRGLRLAELVRQDKTLLILDGVEPLQHPPGPMGGRLKDPALIALVKSLARTNNGLLVLSTREAIEDIASLEETSAPRLPLDSLADADGAVLLEVLGVKGTERERRAAAADYKGHALALSLLGTYLVKAHEGEIRKLPQVAIDVADEVAQGGHAWRVIAAYEDWLGEREVSVLRLLGLFDRPAEAEAIAALRAEPTVPYLNDGLVELGDANWNVALSNLREAGLVLREEGGGEIDAHPLVRAYFGHRLERDQPAAWREGHRRLFEHYRRAAPELPDTLEEMMPLFAAVVHGCRAGLAQQACDEVYHSRICRGKEHFHCSKLGAFGADLVAVTAFFVRPWSEVDPSLRKTDMAWLLNTAGFVLQSVGRLAEAVEPMEAGLAADRARDDWENAAISAGNLSQIALTLGRVDQALERADEAVELADRSGDAFQRMSKRTTKGNALHDAGRLDEAVEAFREAEAMQAEWQPSYPLLYSLQGYQYCDLLLAPPGPRAWSALGAMRERGEDGRRLRVAGEQVAQRAKKLFEWRLPSDSVLDIAVDHLSLGWASFGLSLSEAGSKAADAVEEAATHLRQAVEGLRASGQEDFLPRGLLARAAFRRVHRDRASAEADLDEAEEIADRGQMRLFLADTYLERTHLHLAYDELEAARACLVRAKELIEQCGYGRRRPDVAFLEEVMAER